MMQALTTMWVSEAVDDASIDDHVGISGCQTMWVSVAVDDASIDDHVGIRGCR